jgi:2,5-diketo-D-gluconate reductase A
LAVIPKAGDLDHLADNWGARSVTLSDEDVAAIDAMDDPEGRIGPDPLTF